MTLKPSWVTSANAANHPFPLNNLPYGVFSNSGSGPRCGVAIGDMILDLRGVEAAGLITVAKTPVFDQPTWNAFMALGRDVWGNLRATLTDMLADGSDAQTALEPHLVASADAQLYMPVHVPEYTDFYAGRNHAFNVGTMFRGPENALPPNWLHLSLIHI